MNPENARLIANLRNDPAYIALLTHLDEEVAGILNDLEGATDSKHILRLTRLWQVATRLVSRLRIAPQAMSELFAEEKTDANPQHAHLLADEDPFSRPSRPIPPPAAPPSPTAKIFVE